LWFSKIERDLLARGIFTSVSDLARKIRRYIRHYNRAAKRGEMGSIAVAAWIAKGAFLVLLAVGVWSGDLRRTGTAVFLALGLSIWLALPYVPNGVNFVTPALAILDIGLVFAVFKKDVRIG
jgi:hypothetical protein